MSSFSRFSSIENSYRESTIEEIRNVGFDSAYDWCVLEKAHGCLENRTMISMADGTQEKISNIVKNKITKPVLGVDDNGNIVETPILNHFNNGETDEWLKITFKRTATRIPQYLISRKS